MIVALKCDKILLVQAEFDGELDAAEAAALAVHRQECAICQAAAAELTQARALIGDDLAQRRALGGDGRGDPRRHVVEAGARERGGEIGALAR